MSKKQFQIRIECLATIELDDAVINAVDDEWRSNLYNLRTPEEIAEHIGYNLIVNRVKLSSMDGWADKDDSLARIVGEPEWSIDDAEMIS